jgi:pyruvate-ferredoxin/flavodoxin oxidoreductase
MGNDRRERGGGLRDRTNEVIATYPITPASPIGEQADEWSAFGEINVWGTVPLVIKM